MPIGENIPDYDCVLYERHTSNEGHFIADIIKTRDTVKPKWILKVFEKGSWHLVELGDFKTLKACRVNATKALSENERAWKPVDKNS